MQIAGYIAVGIVIGGVIAFYVGKAQGIKEEKRRQEAEKRK